MRAAPQWMIFVLFPVRLDIGAALLFFVKVQVEIFHALSIPPKNTKWNASSDSNFKIWIAEELRRKQAGKGRARKKDERILLSHERQHRDVLNEKFCLQPAETNMSCTVRNYLDWSDLVFPLWLIHYVTIVEILNQATRGVGGKSSAIDGLIFGVFRAGERLLNPVLDLRSMIVIIWRELYLTVTWLTTGGWINDCKITVNDC